LGLVLVLLLHLPAASQVAMITTPQIIAQTTAGALNCMRWMPVGLCIWLRCSWRGCHVRTSIKVGHYNPNLVVGAYSKLGGTRRIQADFLRVADYPSAAPSIGTKVRVGNSIYESRQDELRYWLCSR
jgi:hypothetical protein